MIYPSQSSTVCGKQDHHRESSEEFQHTPGS